MAKQWRKGYSSKMELELLSRLKDELPGDNIIGGDRSTLSFNQDIDIFIPGRNVAIEFNGDLWHSDAYVKLNTPHSSADEHHSLKRDELKRKGIKLFFVWEYFWVINKDAVVEQLVSDIKSGGRSVHPVFELTTGPMNDWFSVEDIYDAEERIKPEYRIDDCVADIITSGAEYRVLQYIKDKNSLWRFWMGVNQVMNEFNLSRRDVQNAVVNLKEKGVIRYLDNDCFMLDPRYRTTTAKIKRKQAKEFPSRRTVSRMRKIYKMR